MDSYAMAIAREVARLHQEDVSPNIVEEYAKGSVLYAQLVSIESKLDKAHKQQMMFVDAITRLVEVLEKKDE